MQFTGSSRENKAMIRPVILPRIPVQPVIQQPIIQQLQPSQPKQKWGPFIWYLFHTLSYKVKDEYFAMLKDDMIKNFVAICKNLPCPACATHATEYMAKVNFSAIRTKEDFKLLFFRFHNDVNKRKGYPEFSYKEFEDKYSNANTLNIINQFLYIFQNRSLNIRLISDDIYRKNLSVYLSEWFKQNLDKFVA